MKRTIQALVAATAVGLVAAPATVHAVAPVVAFDADAALNPRAEGDAAPILRMRAAFSTDTPGAPRFTLQKLVMHFPDRAGTNGRLFPSCSAEQIERWRGDVRRCPAGSKLGGGTLRADAIQLGIAPSARVLLFNGPQGRSITFNVLATNPALVNESIDAPLLRRQGADYGEQLTLVVPHELQEILDGVFVGVASFDVTLSGRTRVDGVDTAFIRARRCPTRAIRGTFDFVDWETGQTATATAEQKVRCRVRGTG